MRLVALCVRQNLQGQTSATLLNTGWEQEDTRIKQNNLTKLAKLAPRFADLRPEAVLLDYRNGTTCLLAALSVYQGEVTAKCVVSADSQDFLKFIKQLYRKKPGKDLHVIVDNLATHKQALVGQIMEYIKNYNQLWAKPFRWAYTGEPLTV